MNFELSFTTFFDVKEPVSDYIEDAFNNTGIDVFMPKPTPIFIQQLYEANKNIMKPAYPLTEDGKVEIFSIPTERGSTIPLITFKDNKYYIYKSIQIPLGISFLIPKGYHIDLRSKSSNFGNNFSSVTGLVDENYTYGIRAQLFLVENDIVSIEPNQKICQLELKETNFITKLNKIELSDWENNSDVILRREKRGGGFGFTGKF
jgi:dUTPase